MVIQNWREGFLKQKKDKLFLEVAQLNIRLSLHLVVNVKEIIVKNKSPNEHLGTILNEENDDAVDPDPEGNLLVVIAKTMDMDSIELTLWPSESKCSRERKGNAGTNKKNRVWFTLEEELVGSTCRE